MSGLLIPYMDLVGSTFHTNLHKTNTSNYATAMSLKIKLYKCLKYKLLWYPG